MKLGRRGLVWMALSLLLVGLGAAALYYVNDWLLSGVMTVSVCAWLTGLLAVIYSRPERRAVVIGAVLAGFLYVLFALGPWFRIHIGPWLLTSQALVHVETKWLGRQPQVQQLAFANVANPYINFVPGGTGTVTMPQVFTGTTLTVVGSSGSAQHGPFLVMGHWLFGWLAAGTGAIVAGWMARRREQSLTKSDSGTQQ